MCGFAGIFFPKDDKALKPDAAFLKCMTDSIAHRGPDGEGFFAEPHIGLGHRRLSIIDIAMGQQPLFNEDHSVVVVFNGEIYNYQELVLRLTNLGHQFRTASDTEVIVHAWEQWGSDCVSYFRGMFAFALWDRKTKSLFLARDHMGVKPVYWGTTNNGSIVFGSELKALMRHPQLSRTINPLAADDYFNLGFVPDPKTILSSCHKLPPSSFLLWQVGQKSPTVSRYWKVQFAANTAIDEQRAQTELQEQILDAVKLRMVSEVPIGAFLSGGVDSSIVVASMAKLNAEPVKTCSIGFDVSTFDESDYALQVATQFKTNHYAETISVDEHNQIDKLAAIYDEPFADSSAIPTIRVCELARRKVTVALSGDGGDETFAGYSRYLSNLTTEKWRNKIPQFVRKNALQAIAHAYPKIDWAPRPFRLKNVLNEISVGPVEAYLATSGAMRPAERARVYTAAFQTKISGYRTVDQMLEVAKNGPSDTLSCLQNLDYNFYLPGDINVKVDRASMSVSLESREPLMDVKLVEWAATISPSLKISGGVTKYILKKAFEKTLPNDILYRQKMGFSVPLADWFRSDLGTTMQLRFASSSSAISDFVSISAVNEMLAEHISGRRNWATPLWSILMFDASLRHIESMPAFNGSTEFI
jgi:asparagine synthase (glutamine-hydrolysing)